MISTNVSPFDTYVQLEEMANTGEKNGAGVGWRRGI